MRAESQPLAKARPHDATAAWAFRETPFADLFLDAMLIASMAWESDGFAGLSASGVCAITGVRPQTRATWVRRGLLRSEVRYGELDVIEQAVVKELLATLPKSQVELAWHQVQARLREQLVDAGASLVWDPQIREVSVTTSDAELREAVVHGRPVQVLALGQVVVEARRVYRAERQAAERSAAARRDAPAQRQSGTGLTAVPSRNPKVR